MKPDGTEVTLIVNDVGGIPATVSWIPWISFSLLSE
jgi:hypothetical protein